MEIIVGLGEIGVSDNENAKIKTFALGSCVAMTVFHPQMRAAGMIHIVLPKPLNEKDIRERPGYFAETGVPLLIDTFCNSFYCLKQQLVIQIYGGADSKNENDVFQVGKRNVNAVKNILDNMGLNIAKSDIGGYESRTVEMDVKTGKIIVSKRIF